MKTRLHKLIIGIAVLGPLHIAAEQNSDHSAKHQHYRVVILPPDGGADSLLAGYLYYAPLTNWGTIGVAADTATAIAPPFNSYTWTRGKQIDFQPLPQLPELAGTGTYINWINELGVATGYGTRTNSVSGASLDNAAIWAPNGKVFELDTPEGDQSHGVWINDFGQVSGWIANSTPDACSEFYSNTGFQTQGVVWKSGVMVPLGSLGGANSDGEFINNRGQVSGHAETSNVPDPITKCPPFDPFIWENGKMIDINPGNFGGPLGGTNYLNNHGQAVGYSDVQDGSAHPFLWDNGKITDLFTLGNLGGSYGGGLNVNEKGHVVGIAGLPGDGSYDAVLWRGSEFIDLKTLPGDACSQPTFISSRDQIVGVSAPCDFSTQRAFLWENGEMIDLNLLIPADAGIELTSADWINDQGEIAAQGTLTAGGSIRVVVLIPDGDCIGACEAALTAAQSQAVLSAQTTGTVRLGVTEKAQLRMRAIPPIRRLDHRLRGGL